MPLTDDRTFVGRHQHLMEDPDATLPCCYHEQGAFVCDVPATHALLWEASHGYAVVARNALPLLRDVPDTVGLPPRGRRHPEFCSRHAAMLCTQWRTHVTPAAR
jgi:hypothetical protein